MPILQMAFKNLLREKYNPEFRILTLALAIAVFSVTMLCCLTQSLQTTLVAKAAALMGADLIAESPTPLNNEYQQYAHALGLQTTEMVEFLSMVIHGEKIQLASVAAFDGVFPLQGELIITGSDSQNLRLHTPVPPGETWVEDRITQKLGVKIADSVTIGNAEFKITGIIQQHPAAVSDSSVFAPILYINSEDLPKMGVLQPGSRVTYRLLCKGPEAQLINFQHHFQNDNQITWVSGKGGRPALSRLLTYSQRYLAVILLVQILIASIAIAICAHQYSVRQQKRVAIWKSFGASSHTIVSVEILMLMQLAVVVVSGSVILGLGTASAVLHYGLHFGITFLPLLTKGALFGACCGILMLLGFAIPPMTALRRVSPIQIIQRQQIDLPLFSVSSSLCAIIIFGVLLVGYLGDSEVAIQLGVQIFCIGCILFAMGWGLWFSLAILSKWGPLAWRFGVGYLVRHRLQGITQWVVFTVVSMLLLLIQIIQHDFLDLWQAELSPTTPNYFLVNIQPDQMTLLRNWFIKEKIADPQFYPIVRGRMSHVNGISVNDPASKAQGLGRSINLTWMQQLPVDNRVVSGINWDQVTQGQHVLSVEYAFAQRQNLQLNDLVSFEIGNEVITGKIIELRTVQWQTFKPNFFVIFPPNVIDHFPHTYITSFYLQKGQTPELVKLTKEFEEVSIVDIAMLLDNVRSMIKMISNSLQLLLVFVLLLGVLILYASILSTLKERFQESAMLQILGSSKRLVRNVLLIEFGALGLFSGLVASVLALVVAQHLASQYFELRFTFSMRWVIVGTLISCSLITVLGIVGTRSIFRVSPLWLLRQTSD